MRQTDSVVQVQPPEEAQSPKTSLNFSHSLAHENLELKSKLTAEQLVHLNFFFTFLCSHNAVYDFSQIPNEAPPYSCFFLMSVRKKLYKKICISIC